MAFTEPPFEIHVHADVPVRDDVTFDQLQEALKPLWAYAGAKSLAKGAASSYEEEPGIRHDTKEHVLHMCWTVSGDEDFRQALDEMCMNLNELASGGAGIEVSFYDTDFDDDDEDDDHDEEAGEEKEARDDFLMLFVGPTPADIMQVQRDMLVDDVVGVMGRHFDETELGGVVGEIDKLFTQRFDALVSSLQVGRPPRGAPGAGGSHGGARKPRLPH